ncbi:arylsulfatase [Jiangella asiatica]|uniref:Arylsulfatase n=1 Tax=Jiangella asiatica TaxID=2530372 RepID=A0A4R5DSY0_9ACTN|nr:arylsulfatase [Jiangella asiatica]TDE14235.1 arylsulfatase [Jiangella asiatica]
MGRPVTDEHAAGPTEDHTDAAAEATRGFPGHIGRTVADTRPHWEDYTRPGRGAPNVVVIVLDDVGYGQLGCYGGRNLTPAMDGLADQGLRYTNFHVTSLCSTTRASLLTGRNHHAVGMGFLAGFDSGYPGYRGRVARSAATVARMLREAGYGTYALGKWHMTPPAHMSPAGPFTYWPLGQGFDRYYGFLWGEDDQWSPQLWQDNQFVDPPRREGYHFSDDLAGRAWQFIGDHQSANQDRPFFLYLAFGAAHAPHQAPASYIANHVGRFDHGWDRERELVLERQIASGIVPAGTVLPPRNEDVDEWDALTPEQRRLSVRMQEVFAGFMEHTDDAIASVLRCLDYHGIADDTMVLLLSDNGASGEGGPSGSVNEYRYFMGLEDRLEDNLAALDELGGPWAHNHYPAGWAAAGNTPLRYYKRFNHGGGVRAPLVIRWPRGIEQLGELRHQFHHVVDIAPTVLDVAGVTLEREYDGIAQMPVHGTSMRYSFDDATAPTRRRSQYFEMVGSRAIWRDGWKAVTRHAEGQSYEDEPWELYHLDTDVAEVNDRARESPEILDAMQQLWWSEAAQNGVLPLDDRLQSRALDRGPLGNRQSFRLSPGSRLFTGVAGPNWANRSFTVRAYLSMPSGDEEGVLLAFGRRAAGFVLFIQDGRVVFEYNRAGERQTYDAGPIPGPGRHVVVLDVEHVELGSARVSVSVDETETERLPLRTMIGGFGTMSTQIGHNAPSPVSDRFDAPFAFEGEMQPLIVEFHNPATVEPDHDLRQD